MSAGDELEAQTGLSQSWFGDAKPGVVRGVPINDLAAAPAPVVSGVKIEPPPSMSELPALPQIPQRAEGETSTPPITKNPEEVERWQAVIAGYEREAKAVGHQPRAAALYLEIGRIWEEQLGKQRNAAMCYQRAFHLAPKNLAVLHASRRLFTEVGNWGMVVQIIQAEIEAVEDPQRRANLLAEKGTILEQKLKNDDDAQRSFREALDLSPSDPLAIESLEQIHLQRREHEALHRLYVRALESADAPDRKVTLLYAAAQLAEDRLEDPAGAMALYERVLEINPKQHASLAAVRRLAAQAERWDLLVLALQRTAAVAATPEESTSYLMQAARIQQDRLGATDQALFTLLAALEKTPSDLSLLREIEWLYQSNDKHDDVAKVIKFEIEATEKPSERAALMVRLATLLEERLGKSDEAITMYEEALRLVPGHRAVLHPLGRLYERTKRWEPLAKLFEVELSIQDPDPSERVVRLYKLAEVYEGHLSRDADAIKSLEEILTLQSGYLPALKALERLYRKTEKWTELVALYQQEVRMTEDIDHRVLLLGNIGDVLENKLQLHDDAATAYEQILNLRPGHLRAIRTLQRLHEKRGRWTDLLRLLELEVEATGDQNEMIGVLHRAGRVHEEQLGDLTSAIASYDKVLTLSPSYLPTLQALGRLYLREGRWDELIAMYRREIDASKSGEHAIGLLFRIAEVTAEKLKDDDRAIAAYEDILRRVPGSDVALDALAEIYRKRGALDMLAKVLLDKAAQTADPAEKQKALFAVAEMDEHKLGKPDETAQIDREILKTGPHAGALEALVRIYSAKKAWPELIEALESAMERATDPAMKAQILTRIAEVAADRLGEHERAAEYLERAMAIAPDDVAVLRQLERVYLAKRDWPKVVAVSERLAAFEIDPRQYAARQIRLGTIKETDLTPPVSGTPHYLRALDKVPGHSMALRMLEVAYRKAGMWEGLTALYQREALLAEDADRRANLFFRAGDVLEQRMKRDDLAMPIYRAALDAGPGHVPTLRALERIAEKKGDGATLLEMINLEAATVQDPERTLQLLVEAGELYQDKLADIPRAIESFTQVLARAPKHGKAFNRLEAIYTTQKASAPLLELLVTRAQSIDERDDQADLYLSAARVAQEELNDRTKAIALYKEVLERKPMHPKALQRIGPLFIDAEDWTGALDAFHKLVSVTTDPAVRAQGFRSLGLLYETRRDDLVKAVQAYQHAVQADPTDAGSLTALARVYESAQDWGSSVNVLLRLVEVQTQPKERIATLMKLSQIYESGFNDLESAALALQKALENDPTNIGAYMKLAELYERAGNWRMLGQTAESFARALPPNERRRALPLQLKMAEVYEQRLGDDAKAANELRTALEIDGINIPALVMLSRLYGKAAPTFPQAIDIHRRLIRLDPFRVESYHEMRRLFEKRGEYDKAFVCCEILVFFRAQAQDEDLFFHEHKGKVAPIAERDLTPEDHDRLVVHPEERGVARQILEILGSELAKAYPTDLAQYEMNPRTDKHGPKSDLTIRKLADSLAKVLGPPQFDLWITKKFDLGLFLENEEVPALIVGAGLMRRVQEREQRFLLARQIEKVKAGHHLWFKLPGAEIEALVWGAAKLARPDLQVNRDALDLDNMGKKLARFMSRKGRKALEELAPRMQTLRLEVERQRWASIHTANRAGLVLANEIELTIRAIARDGGIRPGFADANGAREVFGNNPEVKELLHYAVSEEYFAARAKLGFSIQS